MIDDTGTQEADDLPAPDRREAATRRYNTIMTWTDRVSLGEMSPEDFIAKTIALLKGT